MKITTGKTVQCSDTKYQLHRALGCNKKAQKEKAIAIKLNELFTINYRMHLRMNPQKSPSDLSNQWQTSALDVSVHKV